MTENVEWIEFDLVIWSFALLVKISELRLESLPEEFVDLRLGPLNSKSDFQTKKFVLFTNFSYCEENKLKLNPPLLESFFDLFGIHGTVGRCSVAC